MSKADRAMSDIDAAASPSSVSSPNNADYSSRFRPKAIYDSETPTSTAQDTVNSSVYMDDCCGDSIELERKMSNAEQLAFRNKAFEFAKPNTNTELPDFMAGEIEYD